MTEVAWIEHAGQRLGLVPALGGGVAAWQWQAPRGGVDLWRPWTGASEDRYTLASFAMLPWSNRISGGGFEHAGRFHPMARNRDGEPYPIHGDGWLQAWQLSQPDAATAVMRLSSDHHGGNPYRYDAEQRFTLVEDGLDQALAVTHCGAAPLPYGLGLHPWFPRTPRTQIAARVQGVWLSGADPIPTRHSTQFPESWDLRGGASVQGSLIDNGYTGWDGAARIDWPEHGLVLEMRTHDIETPRGPVAPQYCLLYRPPAGPAFCFEPITHPIDAFHLEGRPGLQVLGPGQTLTLRVSWRVVRT